MNNPGSRNITYSRQQDTQILKPSLHSLESSLTPPMEYLGVASLYRGIEPHHSAMVRKIAFLHGVSLHSQVSVSKLTRDDLGGSFQVMSGFLKCLKPSAKWWQRSHEEHCRAVEAKGNRAAATPGRSGCVAGCHSASVGGYGELRAGIGAGRYFP